jgi:methionyl-tRNA formyltransferase
VAAKLRAVFMGTPEFAVPSLRAVAEAAELALVVTQPDRPAGRGRRLEPPPVKTAALELGARLVQPDTTRGGAFLERVAACAPDVIVTAAFGRILGRRLLAVPRLACLNVHASLLPAYRGAAPIARAILNGERRTGVSIMRMEAGLDTGPVYRAAAVTIGDEETAGELTERLAGLGARLVAETLADFARGDVATPAPQDEARASFAPPLEKREGRVDWTRSAAELHAHVRGMHPWPCAAFTFGDQDIKVHRAVVLDAEVVFPAQPGEVLDHSRAGVDVACGRGALRVLDVQMPGKKRLDAASFHAGFRFEKGALLA